MEQWTCPQRKEGYPTIRRGVNGARRTAGLHWQWTMGQT